MPTGSVSNAMTMGIVEVASLAARVTLGPVETMMSTLRRTSSAASAGEAIELPLCISIFNDDAFALPSTQARADPGGMPRGGPRSRTGRQHLAILSGGLSLAA